MVESPAISSVIVVVARVEVPVTTLVPVVVALVVVELVVVKFVINAVNAFNRLENKFVVVAFVMEAFVE